MGLAQKSEFNLNQQLKLFALSKTFDYIIISLVVAYTAIVFIYFAFQDDDSASDLTTTVGMALYVIQIIEFAILVVFLLEIILKVYFKDYWLIFDFLIILLSGALIIVDWKIDSPSYKRISRILRTIFRFLRLFLVFRKATQIKKISLNSRYKVNTPLEKIYEIIKTIQESIEDPDMIKKLDWCKEMLSSDKLYLPILGVESQEAVAYTAMHQSSKKNKAQVKRSALDVQLPKTEGYIHSNQRLDFESVSIPDSVSLILEEIGLHIFDGISAFQKIKQNQVAYLLIQVFEKTNLCQKLSIDPKILFNFGNKIQEGYNQNPYHNQNHAFDIIQTSYFLFDICGFAQNINVTILDHFILYFSAAIHDYDHPGFNNPFLINTRHELAILYNDKSPLENHHASSSFFLIQDPLVNVLANFSKEEEKRIREKSIQCVLSTDMSVHYSELGKLKGRLESPDFVVKPYYEVIKRFSSGINDYFYILDTNKDKWKELVEQYETEMQNYSKDREREKETQD